jgi:hypothetical protein
MIEFLVAEKESVRNIHKHLCSVYGSAAFNRSTVDFLIKRVMASATGKSQLHDWPCSGHPVTAVIPEMLQHGDAVVCKA